MGNTGPENIYYLGFLTEGKVGHISLIITCLHYLLLRTATEPPKLRFYYGYLRQEKLTFISLNSYGIIILSLGISQTSYRVSDTIKKVFLVKKRM